ncbi:MAG: phosphatidylglycerophosphatase A [Saprospiraceae bacterium]|nr:phosphatidylglycerophosphatase A [Saprospiraceae bacterium]MDW8229329.1 phosphatidylglycerophosphatase A [Saprospiraceae bacterium]
MAGSKRRFDGVLWVLCGFGAGRLPVAPGTWGAALAWLLAGGLVVAAPVFYQPVLALAIAAGFVVGIVGIPRAEALWGKDPSPVVLDEMVGMWVALWVAPVEWEAWAVIFASFRLFDIFKPLGIRSLERLPGGWGVMLDDILAGIYAWLSWQVFWWLWN